MHQFELHTDGLSTIAIVNRDTDREVLKLPYAAEALATALAAVVRLNLDLDVTTTDDARDAIRGLRRSLPDSRTDVPVGPSIDLQAVHVL